ncbi:hypothetical protein D9M68_358640 [compost metagenome]
MKFKYVNPKAVEEVMGKYAPVNPYQLSWLIDEALNNTNQGYIQTTSRRRDRSTPQVSDALTGVVDRMLADNIHRAGRPAWSLFGGLDFDLVLQYRKLPGDDQPTLLTRVAPYFDQPQYSRPEGQQRVVLHIDFHVIEGTDWSISFPVQIVMKGYPKIADAHVGYSHSITLVNDDGSLGMQHFYIGISKRNWLERMGEHFREIRNGSNKTFHTAWRQYVGTKKARLHSELIVTNHTFKQIMDWEEDQVDLQKEQGNSLNMIPGGFKGLKFLHEHRLLASLNATLEEREAAIVLHEVINPRAGIPNLLISALWKDPDYAALVICGAEGRLSQDQVREIRALATQGISHEDIMTRVGARNILQVRRVAEGLTYARIK